MCMPINESKVTFVSTKLWSVSQLRGERGHGFGVDVTLVPMLKHRKIWASGLPVLALLPAIVLKEVSGGRQHVGRAAQEVATAVRVEIDGELDVVRRHELGLADFAGPGAVHFGGTQVAAVDDPERIQQFAAE